jgi:MinD superfamily P-loop ATPase
MIIAITGGKGGTGKSTVATSLAYKLSKTSKVLLIDADVDCPNDHLLLDIKREHLKKIEQRIPKFDYSKCKKCGACASVCKSNAIVSVKDQYPIFLENQCNGCGACKIVCKFGAISWTFKEVGNIYRGKKDNLDLLSGELKTNQPVSEFVVNHLNKELLNIKDRYDYVIIDTAAGTHCPVIAALENAEKVIAVTEPTPLGSHDLNVILGLLKKMNKEGYVIINRADIGNKDQIISLAKEYDRKVILEIKFSKEVIDSYTNGKPIIIPNIEGIFNLLKRESV